MPCLSLVYLLHTSPQFFFFFARKQVIYIIQRETSAKPNKLCGPERKKKRVHELGSSLLTLATLPTAMHERLEHIHRHRARTHPIKPSTTLASAPTSSSSSPGAIHPVTSAQRTKTNAAEAQTDACTSHPIPAVIAKPGPAAKGM